MERSNQNRDTENVSSNSFTLTGETGYPDSHPPETIEDEPFHALEARLQGTLVLPNTPAYDEARQVWNGLIDRYPAVMVRCATATDVSETITFARTHDLPISARGGGHHESGNAVAPDGVVVDCSGMDEIEVDTDARTARVGPGVRAGELHEHTQQFGLAASTGSAGNIGIAGSTLDGAIGWLRRKHGLGIDGLRSVEIVTADGEIRTASPEQNTDLFWAVRGGGSNVGIVTEFTVDLYEVGPEVLSLGVFYPAERAETVLKAHRRVMADAPDELTTFVFYGHVPPLPTVPEAMRGSAVVGVFGGYVGSIEEGAEAIAPLREITEPIADLSGPMPYSALHEMGSAMFPEGRNYCWRSSFVDELTDNLIERLIECGSEAPSPLSSVEAWRLGGEMGRVEPDETAFAWRDAEYLLTVAANWEGAADEANIRWARETDAAFRELGAEGAYAGFPGLGGTDEDLGGLVYGDNYCRLTAVKDRYNSSNQFHASSDVEPAAD